MIPKGKSIFGQSLQDKFFELTLVSPSKFISQISPKTRLLWVLILCSGLINTENDLKSYALHPKHLKIISSLKAEGVTTKVVDFSF